MLGRTLVTVFSLVVCSQSLLAADEITREGFIRLVDPLDEPEYYCLDVAGWSQHLLLDDPMQTHTCKIADGTDQMFEFEGNRLRSTTYDRCVQVSGSGSTTLAGSAVMARPCSDSPLQNFSMDQSGRIRFSDSNLCLAAGPDSTDASGPSHLWRLLSVVNCDTAPEWSVTWQVGLD